MCHHDFEVLKESEKYKVMICVVCGEEFTETSENVDEKEAKEYLDTAISEINYALKSDKSQDVKEFYLENAIRFIELAKEKLML